VSVAGDVTTTAVAATSKPTADRKFGGLSGLKISHEPRVTILFAAASNGASGMECEVFNMGVESREQS
jgi:hypothetical protein